MILQFNFTDVFEYAKLIITFLVMYSIGKTIYRYKHKYLLAIVVIAITFPLHYIYGQQFDSLYKQMELPRYSNQTQLKSHFRLKGRKILQNHNDENKDEKYAELQNNIEILTNKNKRIFYDKFDKIFENQDFDEREFKEIYSIFLRNKIFDVLNISFYWIILMFVIGKSFRNFKTINFGIKFIFFWTFLLIYYIYSHELDTKSWLDYYYPFQNMSQQVKNSQIILATYLGILSAFVLKNSEKKREQMNENLTKIRQKLDQIDQGKYQNIRGLQAQLKSYQDFINKKQLN